MPGYRALSAQLAGTAADHARQAELRQRGGDPEMAARLLEEALEASLRVRTEMPGWLCGRLAAIYRTLKRYDDEVDLLERYRESQSSEDARTRFDARLSKARAIADRKRRPTTGALETVRQVRHRSSQRRRTPAHGQQAIGSADSPPSVDSPDGVELRAALCDLSSEHGERVRTVLTRMYAESHADGAHVEDLVATLKGAWTDTSVPADFSDAEWHERYSSALVELLAIHLEEPTRS